MKGHVWQPAAYIRRSKEDAEVWVPYIPDGKADHCEHAGLIRKVKQYVASQATPDADRWRWIRKGDDAWEFQALRPVPAEEEPDEVHPYDYHNPDNRRLAQVGLAVLGLALLVMVGRRLLRRR